MCVRNVNIFALPRDVMISSQYRGPSNASKDLLTGVVNHDNTLAIVYFPRHHHVLQSRP
jgi:hypothetical protein